MAAARSPALCEAAFDSLPCHISVGYPRGFAQKKYGSPQEAKLFLDRPDLIVDTIREVWERARKNR